MNVNIRAIPACAGIAIVKSNRRHPFADEVERTAYIKDLNQRSSALYSVVAMEQQIQKSSGISADG